MELPVKVRPFCFILFLALSLLEQPWASSRRNMVQHRIHSRSITSPPKLLEESLIASYVYGESFRSLMVKPERQNILKLSAKKLYRMTVDHGSLGPIPFSLCSKYHLHTPSLSHAMKNLGLTRSSQLEGSISSASDSPLPLTLFTLFMKVGTQKKRTLRQPFFSLWRCSS